MADWDLKQLAHPFLRFAYWAYANWLGLTNQSFRGAAVAIWHGGEILIVRHSYRTGLSLPGGRLRRGEDPRLAACREIREEVGIDIQPKDLVLITNAQMGRHRDHIYEYWPSVRPSIEIDQWEIVEAKFVRPDELAGKDYLIHNYLRAAHSKS